MANGSKILQRWGIPLEEGGMIGGTKSDIVRGRTMDLMFSVDGPEEAEKMGGLFYTGRRSDLLKLLVQKLLQEDGTGKAQLQYLSPVIDYDPETPAVKLASGESIAADLVVACDGMQMASRKILTTSDHSASPSGILSVQIVHKSEKLANDPALSGKGRVLIAVDDEEDDRYSWLGWQCDKATSYASYMRVPVVEGFSNSEQWETDKDGAALLGSFLAWDPIFTRLLKSSDEIYARNIHTRTPVDQLYSGRACVLGDALRPMPPFRAQNIPQAIEDAAALQIFMTGLKSKGDVPLRLKALNDFRMLHVRTVQTLCGQKLNGPAADQEIEKLLEVIRPWYNGRDKAHRTIPNIARPSLRVS